MHKTVVHTPMSQCQVGVCRCDITPPIGIYHRFWGAAKRDQATDIHRPLTATAFAICPLDEHSTDQAFVMVAIDHCLFRPVEMDEVLQQTCELSGLPAARIKFMFSHTHAGGNLARNRTHLPGGDKIGPYLDSLPARISDAIGHAIKELRPATMTYANAACNMGHNRDYWDAEHRQFVCGFNPNTQSNLPVKVVRLTDANQQLLATVVNYPCHPTTLAWENTRISPDYVGAMREVVETATGVPCVFLLAPCGDTGPRYGFVGDVDVADRNGKQLGYAALSALQSMPPVETDFHYVGPVLSGATLGAWEHRPTSEARRSQATTFQHDQLKIPLTYLPGISTVAQAERDLQELVDQESQARREGNDEQTQRARALAERQRRLLERIRPLPEGTEYPFAVDLWHLGDAVWVALEGEPYYQLQEQLAARFPANPLILMPLANGSRSGYLPTREAYDTSRYQVEVSVLEAGSLEAVTQSIAARIADWINSS